MKLRKVRVQDFRCVEDSTEFSLDDVTCLVGKNESGKTALLKALHRLKPDDGTKSNFINTDYPRRKWRPDSALPTTPPVITTTWELDDHELAKLSKEFGAGVIKSKTLTITKYGSPCARSGSGCTDEEPD